jgi:hypothetical protein
VDVEWGDIGRIFGYLAPVVLFLIFNVLFRKQQEQKRRVAVVKSLLSEIDHNQKLAESFSVRSQAKKFKTATWDRNREKIDYIEDGELYSTLVDAYEIIKEFNRGIDTAKKYKSTSYLMSIKSERLREPLTRSKQGLQEWLELNEGGNKIPAGM